MIRKSPADASLLVAVNVSSVRYEAEAKRVLKLIRQGGYECHPMTGEYLLKMAEQVKEDLRAAAEADRLLDHATTRRENDGSE